MDGISLRVFNLISQMGETSKRVRCTISKTRASVSSGYPNTEKWMKARGRRPSAFVVSRCLDTPMKHEARVLELTSHEHMSRAASVCRDDFQPGITWGEPARLMADATNHGRPKKRAWFWCEEGLMSRAGPANAVTWKNLSSVSRDLG